jgi:hypothetical protein
MIKKRRRRTSQVYPTEKPSIYVILVCMAIGVSLLAYFFNPYNQVTSPLPPQPASLVSKYTVPGLPVVPSTTATSLVPTNSPDTASAPVTPPAPAEASPSTPAPMTSEMTNAAPVASPNP